MQASYLLSPPSLPPHAPLPEHPRPFPLLEHPAPIFQKCPLKLLPLSTLRIWAPPFALRELLFSLVTGIANLGEPRRLATWGWGSCQILSLSSPSSHRHPAAASPHWHAGETHRWNQSSLQHRAERHSPDRGDKDSPAWGRGGLRVERAYFGAQCFLLKHS